MRTRIREMVFAAFLTALLIVSKEALAFLPNIELVTLLLILYTLLLPRWVGVILVLFVGIEVFLYGFGFPLWIVNYLYMWPLLVGVTLLMRRFRSPVLWAVIAGFFGLFFGALSAIPLVFLANFATAVAYWISGLWFDIVHGIGNFVLTLLLFQPLYFLLERSLRMIRTGRIG